MVLELIKPPKDGLTPEEYRKYVVDEIARLGIADQLSFKEFIVLYSGPAYEIQRILFFDLTDNTSLSEMMAGDLDASRVNDTEAAKFLSNQKLNEYFEPQFAGICKTRDELRDALNDAYATVWGGISELFAKRDFRHVATAVCGADRCRVFIRDELHPLIDNKSVETTNGIFHAAVVEMFYRVGQDAAFDLICRSEINFMHALSSVGKRGADEYENEINERLRFYRLERDNTPFMIKALNVKQMTERQDIISKYGLDNLYSTEPETWGKQIMPILSVIPREATRATTTRRTPEP